MRFLLKTFFWVATGMSVYCAFNFYERGSTVWAIVFGINALICFICVLGVKHRCPNCHKWFSFYEQGRDIVLREQYQITKEGRVLYRTIYNVTCGCSDCGYTEDHTEKTKDS